MHYKPNNHELGEIFGKELNRDEEITQAARKLQQRGARLSLIHIYQSVYGCQRRKPCGGLYHAGPGGSQHQNRRIAGEQAIAAISDAVRRSRAGLNDPRKPIGSFIFLGTTGVCKTELAKELAEFLFNDDSMMTRIDMSEYQ